MGEQVWGWLLPPSVRGHSIPYGISVILCGLLLLGFSPNALAQYMGAPSVFRAPSSSSSSPASSAPNADVDAGTVPSGGLQGVSWLFTPSISISETYNDNVDLAPPGQARSDLITAVTPSLNVVGQTARANVAFTYNPQLLLFALGTSSPVVQQQLLGTGKIEVYPEMLFVDGSASISQAYISNTGPIAATTLTTNNNLQTVEAVNFSPYLVHHYGSYADGQTRYSYGLVAAGAGGIGTQTTNELSSVTKSGDYFGPLNWTLTTSYTRVDGLSATTGVVGGSARTDALSVVDASYPIYDRVSATGSLGYQSIKDPTLTTNQVGLIWNVGLRYDPSPFASVSASYGHRNGGTDYAFSARYDLGAQTHLNASYTQTVETTQSLIAANLNGLVVGPGGVLINPKTGLPVVPGNNPFGPGVVPFSITNGSFLDKRFQLDASATRGRNTYSLLAYADQQSEQVNAANERAIGGSFTWSRQLWPRLTSNFSATYANIGFLDGSGRNDNYYSASASLVYTLARDATAQISFVRSDRVSSQTQNNLVDDLITFSVQKRF